MNQVANVVRLHSRIWTGWFLLPWAIMLSSFVINLIIAALLGGDTSIYTGGLSSIYLYMLVWGSITLKETYPFALGFSVRRRDYYLGTLGMSVAASAITATLIWLLSIIEGSVIPGWGIKLHFFHLPYLNDGPLAGQFWIFFVVMLCMYWLGFAPASVFQRFRSIGLLTLGIALLLLFSILWFAATRWSWWGAIFHWFAQQSAFTLASWTLPIIALCLLASYAFLRKATA